MARSMGARLGLALTTVVTLAACDDGTGPDAPAPDGIDFGLAQGAVGAFYADRQAPSATDPLASEFAVAVPDSLGGLVLLAYDGGTKNLFILQVREAEVGSYTCGPVENGPACHARLFENVREVEGVVQVDGRLDLVTGSLTLNQVGSTSVAGTFQGNFDRTAGEGEDGFDVVNGTILVDRLPGTVEGGSLACLVALAMGGTTCS